MRPRAGGCWRYYVSRAALTGRTQEAGSVVRIPAPEIENWVANAIGAYLAARVNAIDGCHINRGDGRGDYAITQHEFGPMRRDLPSENDVRNAIERVTVGATRIEIVLNESIVSEGQHRVLTLPWTPASSRPRREIIQGVGEPQRPLRAMRTKARDGFIRALGDARRWLGELLIDPAQTIESLAMREHKSERSIRMTVSLAVRLSRPGKSRNGGSPSARVQRQAPDRSANALVRAMASSGTARGDSASRQTQLIHAVFDCLPTLYSGVRRFGPTASIVQPGKPNFAGRDWPVKFGADHGRTTGIRFADALRLANLPELRTVLVTRETAVGLPGLDGGRCRDRTCDPSRVKGVLYR